MSPQKSSVTRYHIYIKIAWGCLLTFCYHKKRLNAPAYYHCNTTAVICCVFEEFYPGFEIFISSLTNLSSLILINFFIIHNFRQLSRVFVFACPTTNSANWCIWSWLITYHSPFTQMIVAMIPAEHCWFYDSGFNLNKVLHTLLILPTSVYDIDLSILCIDIHTYPCKIFLKIS